MRGRRLASLLAGCGVVLVALMAAYAGPVQIGDPVIPFDRLELSFFEEPEDEQHDGPLDAEEAEFEASALTIGVLVFGLVVGAIALVVAAIALMWALRRLRHLQWKPPARAVDDDYAIRMDAALAVAVDEATREAEAVPPGKATDAVVACWVRLERAAADVDLARPAHFTPSEFTAALLTEKDADADAVARLLALYHRARFGAVPLPDEASTQAADALRRIAATLNSRRSAGDGAA